MKQPSRSASFWMSRYSCCFPSSTGLGYQDCFFHPQHLRRMLETSMARRRKPTNRIKYYRLYRSMKLAELAMAMGCSQGSICKWQREAAAPNLRSVLRLSAALMVPVEVLFLERFKKYQEEIRKRVIKARKKQEEIERHKYYFGYHDWDHPGK